MENLVELERIREANKVLVKEDRVRSTHEVATRSDDDFTWINQLCMNCKIIKLDVVFPCKSVHLQRM